MVIKKDLSKKPKESIDFYEEKVYGCLEKYEKDNGVVKVIDEKFITKFKTYLDKCFDDYEIDLEDGICTITTNGYEIAIGLDN